MLSFDLACCSAEGQTRALADSALPHAPIASHREGARLPAIVGPRHHHPPTAPIDHRDRIESGSPLPRRLTVAIP
jgi:hypothetical protein